MRIEAVFKISDSCYISNGTILSKNWIVGEVTYKGIILRKGYENLLSVVDLFNILYYTEQVDLIDINQKCKRIFPPKSHLRGTSNPDEMFLPDPFSDPHYLQHYRKGISLGEEIMQRAIDYQKGGSSSSYWNYGGIPSLNRDIHKIAKILGVDTEHINFPERFSPQWQKADIGSF